MGRNSAVLLEWTKEINTGGVVGQNVSNLLISALNKRGLDRIKPVAIINDTVGTLLAAAYRNGVADIGSICGTGHNSSFVAHNSHIINIESGNFFNQVLPLNQYDWLIDEESLNKQHQRFEKMVSGAYLGELFRLILLDLIKSRYIFSNSKHIIDLITNKYAIESRHICELLTGGVFKLGQEPDIFDLPDVNIIKGIAESLIIRSARLITSTYVGIIDYMDPHHQNNHIIAIDGSIYEKMPLFAQIMKNTLMEVFGDYQNGIAIEFFKDASGIGAAIAAVMAKDNQHKQL